jgi:hypothetical protein
VSSRLRILAVTAATAIMVAAGAMPATAGGIIDPAPIAPGNPFIGQVNGLSVNATIKVTCIGPIAVNPTGHPATGQKVVALPVTPPVSTQTGYTGTLANEIAVEFGPSSGAASPVILHDWAVSAAIPLTLTLPCSGTGAVTFVPLPTSPTARSFTVSVTYVPVP